MRRLALVISLFSLLSCADRQSSFAHLPNRNSQGSTIDQIQFAAGDHLTVIDDSNMPVPNANVLIGQKPGDPFDGNSMTTDASGQIDLPAGWKSDLPVTIQAPGYITLTYSHLSPATQQLQLHKQEGQNRLRIAGETTNFSGVEDYDGKIDFGLVVPSLSKSAMLSFDLSTVLSPETDQISVAGHDVNVPSNVTLPEQTETYVIVPVSLNKPAYRTFVRNPGSYHVNAIHGWFPMQKVVDDVRAGKSFYELINYFQFTSVGSEDMVVNGDTQQDIPVNQISMDSSFMLRAPNFSGRNVMIGMALAEVNGQFVPTDVKKFDSGTGLRLKAASRLASRYALSVLAPDSSNAPVSHPLAPNDILPLDQALTPIFNILPHVLGQDLSQLSFSLQTAGSPSPTFIPLTTKPTVSHGQIQLNVPALPAGLQAIGTYVVYSDNVTTGTGDVHSEVRTRLWELWSDGWASTMTLPEVTFNKVPGHTYRWEVMFLAKDAAAEPLKEGIEALDISTVTNITRNTLDVQ